MITQPEIVLAEPGRFERRTGSLPDPAPGEARVRIRRIGVCGTDIHAFHGRQPFFEYPRLLGHELGAEVVSVNGDSDLKTGEFVAVEPYLNDPTSPASMRGKTNCCESLLVLGVHCDGGMRPELNLPVHKLHRAASASLDQLALVEMLCIGQHAVNRSLVSRDDLVLVLGAGPIGLSVISFLKGRGKRLVVADLSEARLAFCREVMGVDATVLVRPEADLAPDLREAFGGGLPDVIFDATGSRASMLSTFDLAAHGGRIVFVGLFQGDVVFNDPNFHRRELTVMSSRNATSPEFAQVIAAMESGTIDTSPWITHRIAFDDVPERFGVVIADPTLRKAVIEV
jgi:2-desacetyl-2-hydroxyethyl bacteriochlorophyllide A dehydrogenase